MNRPKGLTLTAVLMALCLAMLWATIDYARDPRILHRLLLTTVIISIGVFVVWFYWRGRNWARICVLLWSVGGILSLLAWNRIFLGSSRTFSTFSNTPTHIFVAARAILGAALLYYLNTRPVLDFFQPHNRQARSDTHSRPSEHA